MRKVTDDDFDENGVLKDAHTYRVPMRMADSNSTRRTLDAALHRPGFRAATRLDDSAEDAADRAERRQLAYDMYDREMQDAWKHPGRTADYFDLYDAVTETTNEEGVEGDPCTVRQGGGRFGIEGSPGHLTMIEDVGLVCVADRSAGSDALAFTEVSPKTFASAHNRTDRADPVQRHNETMAKLYAARDAELRDAWRNPK